MDQSNNVHLRWNKHQTTLVSVFDALLDSEKLTDCTISAEGRHLRAHKIILSACSPYFDELFTDNYEKHPIIILHDVKYNTVKALMDFMYHGEVAVPQEELSSVLKISKSLQIRGLSGSGCVDEVNMQKGSGSNTSSAHPETFPSHPASVSGFSSGLNDPEKKVQSLTGCSPIVSSQDGGPSMTRKYRKRINQNASDEGAVSNVFEAVFTPDLDSWNELPSQRPVSHQSVRRELQSTSGDMTVAESDHSLIPAAVVSDKNSTNLSGHQQEVLLKTECEVIESDVEFAEDLVDDNYSGDHDYRGDSNSATVCTGEVRSNKDIAKEIFHTQENNNMHSQAGSDYLNDTTLATPQAVSGKQFTCTSCGNSYRHPSGLWRHMKHQCGKEPQFQCSHCSYRCSRTDTLRRHKAALHHLL